MFDITGDDIAALADDDLRALVGRLCEAELRAHGLPTAAVTWGGNQNAKDGGLDVRVALPAGTVTEGFIPRAETGFQVKKPDMPRAAILDEMKPKPAAILRPVIADLAATSGAYIIVSASGSTSDQALSNRKAAMGEAVADCADAPRLALDFYDRNRLATWVRGHAGLIPWVRARIGKAIQGWRSYGCWSYVPAGTDATYLIDDAVRIRTGDKDEGSGLSAADGIDMIRDGLRAPGHVVRLVGLSGVGKTRLVEALFDPSVGTNALDQSLAVYTNVAEGPDPQPAGLASDLIASGARAILVIDNCPPGIHRQLSDIVRGPSTTVSLITIEYDIREDQPEGTDVFTLDTSSPALIGKLIRNRFPDISQTDCRTITESSGGNARVALALAGTIGKNETISGLSDAELFKRLFQQRNDPDAALLSMAQACSLVYSFEGEKLAGDEAELSVLGGLVGKSAEEMFATTAELKRRDLLQARGPWRAVLPHAIANRLAAMALENIPRKKLLTAFVDHGPKRLLQSFSRRLGYLDGSKEARAIAQDWLAPSGLLADVANLDKLGAAMFTNIAPVLPDAVLSALENVILKADEATLQKCRPHVRLLRSLAYEPMQFTRAVALLIRIAKLPIADRLDSTAESVVESLFYIVLSGTHASVRTRLDVVASLLRSSDAADRRLGVKALEAMMKTSHFSAAHGFEFGLRSRDYGYYPPNGQAVRDWFSAVLQVAESFALSEEPSAAPVRKAIGREFRGLWTNAAQTDGLERIARAIAAKSFWREGWIGVRQTRIYAGKGLAPEGLARLVALEELLRPKDLIDKVRGVVLGSGNSSIELDETNEAEGSERNVAAAMTRLAQTVESLGRDVAGDEEAFKVLLPELMVGDGRISGFGRGLGLAAEDPAGIWRAMTTQFAATQTPGPALIGGFLEGVQRRDPSLADTFLDASLDKPELAASFPAFQAYVIIDNKGVTRLHQALDLDKAPIHAYRNLAYGRACDAISAPEFKRLVIAIAGKPNGAPVAMEILSMRLHANGTDKIPPASEVLEAGRALLSAFEFRRTDGRADHEDYELGVVARASLRGEAGKTIVRSLCRKMQVAMARHEIYGHDQDDLIRALFQVHPEEVLDELIGGGKKKQEQSILFIHDLLRFGKSPMDVIPDDVVLRWCDLDPGARYPFAAAIIPPFDQADRLDAQDWKPLTLKLLEKAPDKRAVFREIVTRLQPTSWSGSLATKLESRLKLLEQLDISRMPELTVPRDQAKAWLQQLVESERRSETEEDRARSSRFE